MKKILTFISLFTFLTVNGQSPKLIKGNLTAVTLHSMGALITETGTLSLNKGLNKIMFVDIAKSMDPRVLLLQFSGNATVVSLTSGKADKLSWLYHKNYNQIIDSIEKITQKKLENSYTISAYTNEKIMLDANNSIGGVNNGVNNLELQKAIDFYRLRIANIYKHLLEAKQVELELDQQLGDLNNRKTDLEIYFNNHNSIIYATVLSEKVDEIFELRYFVNDCGWAPFYDIKITDITKPLSFVYQAKMVNNTGMDWNDIDLTISTADPTKTAQYPPLEKWVLEELNPPRYRWAPKSGDKDYRFKNYEDSKSPQKPSSFLNVSELSTDFKITLKKTIPSDSKPYLAEINTYSITPSYRYIAIPKLDALAYLTCGITDWEQYNLVEGPANVYYGKTFIGESYVAPHLSGDTLEISLGRDQKVVLKYEKKKDFSRKSILGGTITQTFTYEISIRNSNLKEITLEIYDQIPLSPNSDIGVEVTEISKADFTKDDGKLQWNVNLKASETAKYIVSYSIKYPKGRPVQTVRYKKLSCPSF